MEDPDREVRLDARGDPEKDFLEFTAGARLVKGTLASLCQTLHARLPQRRRPLAGRPASLERPENNHEYLHLRIGQLQGSHHLAGGTAALLVPAGEDNDRLLARNLGEIGGRILQPMGKTARPGRSGRSKGVAKLRGGP